MILIVGSDSEYRKFIEPSNDHHQNCLQSTDYRNRATRSGKGDELAKSSVLQLLYDLLLCYNPFTLLTTIFQSQKLRNASFCKFMGTHPDLGVRIAIAQRLYLRTSMIAEIGIDDHDHHSDRGGSHRQITPKTHGGTIISYRVDWIGSIVMIDLI